MISKGCFDKNVLITSKECFLDKNFTYEKFLCNGCHDLMQEALNFNDVAILSIQGSDYRIQF